MTDTCCPNCEPAFPGHTADVLIDSICDGASTILTCAHCRRDLGTVPTDKWESIPDTPTTNVG